MGKHGGKGRPAEGRGLGAGWLSPSCPLPCAQLLFPLTVTEAGNAQGLGGVQRKAVLRVLDVGHDRHGVEVGLQGQLLQIPPRLHLWVRASMSRTPARCTHTHIPGPQGVPNHLHLILPSLSGQTTPWCL